VYYCTAKLESLPINQAKLVEVKSCFHVTELEVYP